MWWRAPESPDAADRSSSPHPRDLAGGSTRTHAGRGSWRWVRIGWRLAEAWPDPRTRCAPTDPSASRQSPRLRPQKLAAAVDELLAVRPAKLDLFGCQDVRAWIITPRILSPETPK